jgi:hypothetical protein
MDERLETWIAAERLIAKYGPDAERVAEDHAQTAHAQTARHEGDSGSADMWALIQGRVRELQAGRNVRDPSIETA